MNVEDQLNVQEHIQAISTRLTEKRNALLDDLVNRDSEWFVIDWINWTTSEHATQQAAIAAAGPDDRVFYVNRDAMTIDIRVMPDLGLR